MPDCEQPMEEIMPQISVGIDIAKEVHWITAIDEAGTVLVDGVGVRLRR
jgi:hypothetical protein